MQFIKPLINFVDNKKTTLKPDKILLPLYL